MSYVKACSGLSRERLRDLLNNKSFYYFLRSPSAVSGFITELPVLEDFPQGQAFNKDVEIRWQKERDSYNVLWLGLQDAPREFKLILGDWTHEDRNAQVYSDKETRLPKEIKHNNPNVGQRYFRNSETGTIHFIALRIK